jgi:hypothetical protein
LNTNKIVNELKPGQLFILKNNDNFQKASQMTNGGNCHLAMFLNGKITIQKIKFKQLINHVSF